MAARCEVRAIVRNLGGRRILDDVSLSIAEGEFVVILGPSGCGKTTTLRLIAGLDMPDGGSISIDGRPVSDPARKLFVPPEQRQIGMVFQSYGIWPHMTVFENVAFPLRVRRVASGPMRAKVEAVLDLVGLAGQGARPATALSGGQMQRVALARALVFDPAMLLFDEPLSNLDLKLRERLRAELKALQRRTGLTSIYVTHDQAEAVELADRIVVMEAGRIVQIGTPEDLYRRPRTRFVAEFIAEANILPVIVEGFAGPGLAVVRTACGFALTATHDGAVGVGDHVDVVVHPEDCLLSAATGDNPSRVVARRALGAATRYTVAVLNIELDVVVPGTVAEFAEQAAVALSIGADRARIISTAMR